MFSRVSFLFALALALTLARPIAAQQTVDVGSISGRVVDEMGMTIPGASVAAIHLRPTSSTTTITDEDGRFRFPYLRIGAYEITVSLAGFKDADPPGRRVGRIGVRAADCAGHRQLARRSSLVHEAPVIESARSQIAATVSEAEVAALPMNGRNFLELALLVPGVAPTNIASTQLFPETSAVPGITLSVGSQRNLSNNFVVDGLSANDDAAGLSGITYRRRCDRAVSGHHVRRAGGARPRAGRLRQRRDEERHQSDCVGRSTTSSATTLNGTNALSGTKLPTMVWMRKNAWKRL